MKLLKYFPSPDTMDKLVLLTAIFGIAVALVRI